MDCVNQTLDGYPLRGADAPEGKVICDFDTLLKGLEKGHRYDYLYILAEINLIDLFTDGWSPPADSSSEVSAKVNISKKDKNIIVEEEDGLYAEADFTEVNEKIANIENNIFETSSDNESKSLKVYTKEEIDNKLGNVDLGAITNVVNDEKIARENADDAIINMIFGIHGSFTYSCNPATIVVGDTSKRITITTGVKFNNKDLTHTVLVNGADKLNSYDNNGQTQNFTVQFVINNEDPKIVTTVNKTAAVTAYHPVYVGFGTDIDSVAVASNMETATNTAKGKTFTKTANANGVYFYILVPANSTNKVIAPTSFSMGGAPFAMTTTINQIVNGVSGYTVFKSGGTYNSGTTVSVTTA